MTQLSNGGREVPTYMHPDTYRSRAIRISDGEMRRFANVPSAARLTQQGARVIHHAEPQQIIDGCFYVSGVKSRE